MHRRDILKVAGSVVCGTLVAGAAEPLFAAEVHVHIRKSLEELREAKKELKEADHDFMGHRVDAIKAIDVAIEQLEICLKHAKK